MTLRPREHYAAHGPAPLPDDQLLALILGTAVTTAAGRRDPLDIARQLLTSTGGLAGLSNTPLHQFLTVPGIGQARAVRLHAALALGRRAAWRPAEDPPRRILGPDQAWKALRHLQGTDLQEELHALYLCNRGRLLAQRCLTRGSDRHTVVDPRQVFRPAVALGAPRVIVAHVHPSGDPSPSDADLEVTRRLAAAGRALGIQLVDHLVLGRGCYRSLAEEGVLPPWTGGSGLATG